MQQNERSTIHFDNKILSKNHSLESFHKIRMVAKIRTIRKAPRGHTPLHGTELIFRIIFLCKNSYTKCTLWSREANQTIQRFC